MTQQSASCRLPAGNVFVCLPVVRTLMDPTPSHSPSTSSLNHPSTDLPVRPRPSSEAMYMLSHSFFPAQ